MNNKKQKPYLEFAGNVFYIDLDSILEAIKIESTPPPQVIEEEKPVKKGRGKKTQEVKEVFSEEEVTKMLESQGSGIQIDISKWEILRFMIEALMSNHSCLLYTSPSPRDLSTSRMPSSA